MLLVLGCLMDMAPLILILTPILLPVVKSIGVDPVHFGMIMMVNLGMGLITPPVGTVLFVGAAVAKLPIEQVTKALLPFFTYVPVVTVAAGAASGQVSLLSRAAAGSRRVPPAAQGNGH
jgi:TRAP-type C4-dicarboxylate transport system permease large subunit